MQNSNLIALLVVSLTCTVFSVQAKIEKILFGSCSHQDKSMPILDAINNEEADLFIFNNKFIYLKMSLYNNCVLNYICKCEVFFKVNFNKTTFFKLTK